ncbi:MAG: hypothetical protein AAF533_11840 [Acidobacteriota bacterium]
MSVTGLQPPFGTNALLQPVERKAFLGSVNADGTVLAYERQHSENIDVWVLDLRAQPGQKVRRRIATEGPSFSPGLDASGDWIAYVQVFDDGDDRHHRILKRNLRTDDPPEVMACHDESDGEIDAIVNLHLSPDASKAVYQVIRGRVSDVHLAQGTASDCETSPSTREVALPWGGIAAKLAPSGQAWTQDGSSFVFAARTGLSGSARSRIYQQRVSPSWELRELTCPVRPLVTVDEFLPTLDASTPERVHFLRRIEGRHSIQRFTLGNDCTDTDSVLEFDTGSVSALAASLDGKSVVLVGNLDSSGPRVWELDTRRIELHALTEPDVNGYRTPHVAASGTIAYYQKTQPNDLLATTLFRTPRAGIVVQDPLDAPPDPFLFSDGFDCDVVGDERGPRHGGGFSDRGLRALRCEALLSNSSRRSRTLLAHVELEFEDGTRRVHGPTVLTLEASQDATFRFLQALGCEPEQGYEAHAIAVAADLIGSDVATATITGRTVRNPAGCP